MSERIDRLNTMLAAYSDATRNGNKLRNMAAEMRALADQASDDFARLRSEHRANQGYDGYGHATNDARFMSLAIAKSCISDNQWYMQRAQTYSGEAAMYYAQASAIMGNIQYERSLLNLPLSRD